MPPLLLFKPLLERLHQRIKPAKRVNLRLLLSTQMLFRQLAQPLLRQIKSRSDLIDRHSLKPLKRRRKGTIKPIKIRCPSMRYWTRY